MNGLRTILCGLCVAILFHSVVHAEEDAGNSKECLRFEISRGVALHLEHERAIVVIRMSTLFKGNDTEQRSMGRLQFQNGILKKIGTTMMMFPLMMQLIGLPGTLASIKMTLLRSILVGKLALAVMIYNAVKNSQKSEVVLIHQPEYHEHYYHTYHRPEDDDEDDGWWGR